MRIALVHDWLLGMRGGEKCLEVLCRLWPDADLYTLIHRRGHLSPAIERMSIRTSFLQWIPGIFKHYRYFLPLMPAAIESIRLLDYDVVVSLSHCVAKSVRVPEGVPHICYCFTPMRYAWHMREAYWAEGGGPEKAEGQKRPTADPDMLALDPRLSTLDSSGPPPSALRPPPFPALRPPPSGLRTLLLADLRRWDRATAGRVTQFVAISRTVEQRIRESYGRDSTVIYPPVDVDFFTPEAKAREDFYLCVSALVPYKRLELAVEACNRLERRLIVIGSGPRARFLSRRAGPNVTLLGWQSDELIRDHYRRCRALLFPGVEDFGIVPLEAQACGAPVIAFNSGGATETVEAATPWHSGSGLFFEEQSTECLIQAIKRFEDGRDCLSAELARSNAERFCSNRFAEQMRDTVMATYQPNEHEKTVRRDRGIRRRRFPGRRCAEPL